MEFSTVKSVISVGLPSNSSMIPAVNQTDCEYFKKMLTFNSTQLLRVSLMWFFFLLSSLGNSFIFYCFWKKKTKNRVDMLNLNLTIADLIFTFFVIPSDAIWNITMAWLGGDTLCKIMQMMKQFGMYLSSSMIVVIGVERACTIKYALTTSNNVDGRRARVLLACAWIVSFLSSIPAGCLFSVASKVFCNNEPEFTQCVDFKVAPKTLPVYHFFTMLMSFILPLLIGVAADIILFKEIAKMAKGREEKVKVPMYSLETSQRKLVKFTLIVSANFIVLWTPYYAFGIYTWFDPESAKNVPKEITLWLFMLLYLHPTVHPLIYGFNLQHVQTTFRDVFKYVFPCCTCNFITVSSHSPVPNGNAQTTSFIDRCSCSKKSQKKLQMHSERQSLVTHDTSVRTNSTVVIDDHLVRSDMPQQRYSNENHNAEVLKETKTGGTVVLNDEKKKTTEDSM